MQIYIPSKFSRIDLRCAKGSIPIVNIWKVLAHLFLSWLLTSITVHTSLLQSRFYSFNLPVLIHLNPHTLLTLVFMLRKAILSGTALCAGDIAVTLFSLHGAPTSVEQLDVPHSDKAWVLERAGEQMGE
jgi:hypothetical protein